MLTWLRKRKRKRSPDTAWELSRRVLQLTRSVSEIHIDPRNDEQILHSHLRKKCRIVGSRRKDERQRREEEMTKSSQERKKSDTWSKKIPFALFVCCDLKKKTERHIVVCFESMKESSFYSIDHWAVSVAPKFKQHTCFLLTINWLTNHFKNPQLSCDCVSKLPLEFSWLTPYGESNKQPPGEWRILLPYRNKVTGKYIGVIY